MLNKLFQAQPKKSYDVFQMLRYYAVYLPRVLPTVLEKKLIFSMIEIKIVHPILTQYGIGFILRCLDRNFITVANIGFYWICVLKYNLCCCRQGNLKANAQEKGGKAQLLGLMWKKMSMMQTLSTIVLCVTRSEKFIKEKKVTLGKKESC